MSNNEELSAEELVDGGITAAEAEAQKADEAAEGDAETNTEQTDESASEESKPIAAFDGHEFKSVDELAGYARALEKSLGRQGQKIGDLEAENRNYQAQQEALTKDEEAFTKEVADLIQVEPEKAIQKITARQRLIAQKEAQAQRAETEFWTDLFANNPHMAKQRVRIQEYTYRVLGPELSRIPPAQHAAFIKREWEALTGTQQEDTDDSGIEMKAKKIVSPRGKGSTPPKPTKQSESTEKAPEPRDIRRKLSYFRSDDF